MPRSLKIVVLTLAWLILPLVGQAQQWGKTCADNPSTPVTAIGVLSSAAPMVPNRLSDEFACYNFETEQGGLPGLVSSDVLNVSSDSGIFCFRSNGGPATVNIRRCASPSGDCVTTLDSPLTGAGGGGANQSYCKRYSKGWYDVQVVTAGNPNDNPYVSVQALAGAGAGEWPGAEDVTPLQARHIVQEEGTGLTDQPYLDFVGSGVTCTNVSASNKTQCQIPGASASAHVIVDETTPLTARDNLVFTGAAVTCTDSDPDTVCDIVTGAGPSSPLTSCTGAQLTAASCPSTKSVGTRAIISDGDGNLDCGGGGATAHVCVWDGTNWLPEDLVAHLKRINPNAADLGAEITARLVESPNLEVFIESDMNLSSTVTISNPGTTVRCAGGVTITRTADVEFFDVQAADFTLENCILDGNSPAYTSGHITGNTSALGFKMAGSTKLVNGSTTTLPLDFPYSSRDQWPGFINVKQLGCTGDGSTDDTNCIQMINLTAWIVLGTEFYFPPGDYQTTVGIVTGQDNTFTMNTRVSAVLTAKSGYTASEPMCTIDCSNPSGNCHGSQCNINFNGSDFVEVGLYSDNVQELGGSIGGQFYNFIDHGVWLTGTSQNFTLREILGVPSLSMNAGYYIVLDAGADPPREFGPFSITQPSLDDTHGCVYVSSSGTVVRPVHCEIGGTAVHSNAEAVFVEAVDHRGATGDNACSVVMIGTGLVGNVYRPPTSPGCTVYSFLWGKRWYSNPTGSQHRFGTMGAIGGTSLGQGNLWSNEAPLAGITDDMLLFRPRITDSLRFTSQDAPQICSNGSRGSVYFDTSLNELCFCDGSIYRQMDGGGSGDATNCNL